MATASDLVTRSLILVGVIASGETPSASDAKDGLSALNDMLHGWAMEGADIQHVTLTASADLEVPDSWLEGIRYNLAVRLASEYSLPIQPDIAIRAADFMEVLRAHRIEFDGYLEADRALDSRYFSRRNGAFNIDKG